MRYRGIWVDPSVGIGDAVQFTSLPENYFRYTGQKLVDSARHWVFDFNPFVDRSSEPSEDQVLKIWNHRPFFAPEAPYYMDAAEGSSRKSTFLSNAEIHARLLGVPVVLNRPRLYRFEEFPFEARSLVLVHTNGRSHGQMPEHVIHHVINKYGHMDIAHVGFPSDPDIGVGKIMTEDIWTLTELISQCRIFIGMDSGPSWIAGCYPDVVVKRLRSRPIETHLLQDWVPLDVVNNHSHWDDRMFQIFNTTEDDVGFTYSYRRI